MRVLKLEVCIHHMMSLQDRGSGTSCSVFRNCYQLLQLAGCIELEVAVRHLLQLVKILVQNGFHILYNTTGADCRPDVVVFEECCEKVLGSEELVPPGERQA